MNDDTLDYLAVLLGCTKAEALDCPVTFQTFSEPKWKGKGMDQLAKIRHGSLRQLAAELDRNNQAGGFVGIAVNETDLRGRREPNIQALRGWHADLDARNAATPFDVQAVLEALPLPPTMVVQTPGGLHVYWLAEEPMACATPERRAEHKVELKRIQYALAHLGADPDACHLEQALRLPGFLHCKAQPKMVELVVADGPRCTREKLWAAFPPLPVKSTKKPKTAPAHPAPPFDGDRAMMLERAGKYLDTIPAAISGQHGHDATFKAALKIISGFDLTEAEGLHLLQDRFNSRCDPPWSDEELTHKAHDAWEAAQQDPDRGHLLSDPKQPWVPGFTWNENGLNLRKTVKDADGHHHIELLWLAPPFAIVGLTRDRDGNGWDLLIQFQDPEGRTHETAVPPHVTQDVLARLLGVAGLVIAADRHLREHLLNYLSLAHAKIKVFIRSTDRLGWCNSAFLLPGGEVIGETDEILRFIGEVRPGDGHGAPQVSGTLEQWQKHVAALAVGNPYLAFAISCAFTGPLIRHLRPDAGGGFHFHGSSSKGKTTALEAAASVWGDPAAGVSTWRATSNGLEGIAASKNDGLLVLDEMSQASAQEAGAVAYMLANGCGKARMTKDCTPRTIRTWRLMVLSSGEQTLEDKLREDGRRVRAGQEVRLVDIQVPEDGMFQDAHGHPNMAAFAEHLKRMARAYHGTAIRAFLMELCRRLQEDEAGLMDELRTFERDWLADVLPPGADGQVQRVAGRFALVAAAGTLAENFGIVPWEEGTASLAAEACFRAWLERRGHAGASEQEGGYQAVQDFIAKHGMARFAIWGDPLSKPANMAGWRKPIFGKPKQGKYGPEQPPIEGWDYLFSPAGWKEACTGFDPRSVAADCVRRGLLEPDNDGKTSQVVRIPGGRGRFYVIPAAALAAANTGEGVTPSHPCHTSGVPRKAAS